jgi:uncharacterized protein (TIGR03790 family)
MDFRRPRSIRRALRNHEVRKSWRVLIGVLLLSAPSAATVLAGGGPQNIAVIVNSKDPNSLEIANEYIRLRQIPSCNVIYLPWAVNVRTITGVDFREKMIEPIFRELERRGLTPQIDCIAYSCGFPPTVDLRADLASETLPPQASPMASLNSATFLYQDLLAKQAIIVSLRSNGYFTQFYGDAKASQAFSSQFGWHEGQGSDKGPGRKFMLSTVLGATIGRGNSVKEIREYLRRAKIADGTAPKGTIYYMQNDNVRSAVRHEAFLPAVNELKRLGVNAEILRGAAPIKKEDVAGLTTGVSHLRLRTADCRLLPGALVDNLTSAAGQLIASPRIKEPQTPVSEFMRMGAAGASGTIVEPYAIPAKFPSPALHVHYVRGLSLAESFYRSVAGPFQLLIIGDPLCQPWAKAPRVAVSGIDTATPLSGQVIITPTATYEDGRQASEFQLYVNGKRHSEAGPGEALSLNTKPLPDGWHRLLVVAIDDTPMAIQGFWSGEYQIKNGRDSLQISVASPKASLSDAIEVKITSTAPDLPTAVFHNGRRLASLPNGAGAITIEASQLGRGVMTLEGIQESNKRSVLRSRPISLEVL